METVKRDLVDIMKCNSWSLIGSWLNNKTAIKTFWRQLE